MDIQKKLESPSPSELEISSSFCLCLRSRRIEKNGQEELFKSLEFVSEDEGHATPEEVEKFWLTKLSSSPQRFDSRKFADLLEETDWFPGDLQEALGRLIASGKVINLDARGKRRKHFLHYDKSGERLQLTGKVQ